MLILIATEFVRFTQCSWTQSWVGSYPTMSTLEIPFRYIYQTLQHLLITYTSYPSSLRSTYLYPSCHRFLHHYLQPHPMNHHYPKTCRIESLPFSWGKYWIVTQSSYPNSRATTPCSRPHDLVCSWRDRWPISRGLDWPSESSSYAERNLPAFNNIFFYLMFIVVNIVMKR